MSILINIEDSLSLEKGYYIANLDVDEQQLQITVLIECEQNIATCPKCDCQTKIHDRLNKKWRHVNLDEYKVFLQFRTPRVRCKTHGVKLSTVSWAKPKGRFTIALEDLLVEQAKDKSILQIAKEYEEHDTRIRRIVKRRCNEKNNN